MGAMLHASIRRGCWCNEEPRQLSEYAEEGLISEAIVMKLNNDGWSTDYQVYANLSAFGLLDERQREELRIALELEERTIKNLVDFLRL